VVVSIVSIANGGWSNGTQPCDRAIGSWNDPTQRNDKYGHRRMQHYSDYVREQAANYRELAEKAEDSRIKKEFLELAAICDEVANKIDDRRASG
jgi:hypothetical protein